MATMSYYGSINNATSLKFPIICTYFAIMSTYSSYIITLSTTKDKVQCTKFSALKTSQKEVLFYTKHTIIT